MKAPEQIIEETKKLAKRYTDEIFKAPTDLDYLVIENAMLMAINNAVKK